VFYLSKLIWALILPGNLLVLGLFGATYLLARRGLRGIRLAALGLLCAFVLAVCLTPLADWTIAPLEDWHKAPDPMPVRADGIIVLGGWEYSLALEVHGKVAFSEAADRFFEGLELARRYPEAKIVFTGGSGDPLRQHLSGGDVAERAIATVGLDPGRVIIERKSRDTYENAWMSKEMVKPAEGQTWLLVTSASHMPRAMGCFRKAGWNVLPIPCDHVAATGSWQPSLDAVTSIGRFHKGLHEWVGLAAYWAAGRVLF
jgi:uncharacterized SAM-binding protein YcdF (DUF218 family)